MYFMREKFLKKLLGKSLIQAFFFDRAKKTQGLKNSKLKQKTQGFGKFWSNLLRKSTEMTKKQGGNYYNTEIKDEMFKTLQNENNFKAKILSF